MNYKVREKLIWLADLIGAVFIIAYVAVKRNKKLAVLAVFAVIVAVLAIATVMGWIDWGEVTYFICRHVKCTGW